VETCDANGQAELSANVFEHSVVKYIRKENYDPTAMGAGMEVDLHGYSRAVARAALRAGLKRLGQIFLSFGRDARIIKDFTFVTGVGRHSSTPFEPVLRPAMKEMLERDFDPPLPCHYVKGNAGRLTVKAEDLVVWLEAHTQGKKHSPADHSGTLRYKTAAELRERFEQLRSELDQGR
jgi:hypothetical protein